MQSTVQEQTLRNTKTSNQKHTEPFEEIRSLQNSIILSPSKITDETTVTMTQIYRILSRLRLNKNEINTYIFLARAGPQKAQNLSDTVKIERTEIYRVLKNLESLGLVSKTLDKPMRFKAKPFETVLESLIQEKKKRVLELEGQKKRILDVWKSFPKITEEENSEGIQVIEGKRQILIKIEELLSNIKKSLQIVVKDSELIWLFNSMFFEDANRLVKNTGLQINLLTNYSAVSEYVFEKADTCINFAFLKGNVETSYIIKDDDELIIIMNSDQSGQKAMYTTYESIINAYKQLYSYTWTSIDRSLKTSLDNKLETSK